MQQPPPPTHPGTLAFHPATPLGTFDAVTDLERGAAVEVFTDPAQVRTLDPRAVQPPLLVANTPGHDDLYEHGEGGKPDRLLPMIGGDIPDRCFPRPYIYDAAFSGGTQRVYADTVQDALAVMLGDEYTQAAAAADESADTYTAADGGDTAFEDLQEAREAMFDADALTFALRAQHSTQVRAQWQQQLRDAADPALMDSLDEWDTRVLAAACDSGGAAPGRYQDTDPLAAALWSVPALDGRPVERLVWRSPIPLVCTTVDYAPYSSFVEPHSALGGPVGEFGHLVDGSESNLLWLRPESEDHYLWSLAQCGIIDLAQYPVEQVDPVFVRTLETVNGGTAEPVSPGPQS